MSSAGEKAEVILIVIKRLIKWAVIGVVGLAAIIGAFVYNNSYQSDQRREVAKEKAKERAKRIVQAKATATSKDKSWTVYVEPDPASSIKIARTASIVSNDGLCTLSVQHRLNGSRLTGLKCPDFKISEYDDLEVKFDTMQSSYRLPLKSYSDSSDVFIPSSDYSQKSGFYNTFLDRMKRGKAMAIKVKEFQNNWVTFTLKNAKETISILGKPFPIQK
jgi:hypothetical protein